MTTTKETKRALIKQLIRYREQTGESMQKVADEIGVSKLTVYNWTSNAYLPTDETVDRLKIFLASRKMTTPTARLSKRTTNKLIEDLRRIKEEQGLTLVELSKKTGIQTNAIAAWLQGLTTPTALNAYQVMNFLNSGEKQTNLFENHFSEQVAKAEMSLTAEDGTIYLSSRSLAEWTEKQHKHLIRDIENYISVLGGEEHSPKLGYGLTMRVEDYFKADTYQIEGGRSYKFYWCSRKGCELIANKMTGAKGIRFTAHYIEYFHAMEQTINEQEQDRITPTTTEPLAASQENSDLVYIKNKLTELQETNNINELMTGLDRVTKLAEAIRNI